MNKQEIYKKIQSLKPGDTFVDGHGYKHHVVVNLPKESGGQIVSKYYGKRKQWWHYQVECYFWFELRMRTPEDIKSLKFKIKKLKEPKAAFKKD